MTFSKTLHLLSRHESRTFIPAYSWTGLNLHGMVKCVPSHFPSETLRPSAHSSVV